MSSVIFRNFSLPRVNSFIYPFSNGLKVLWRKGSSRFVLWSNSLPSIKFDVMLALAAQRCKRACKRQRDAQAQV